MKNKIIFQLPASADMQPTLIITKIACIGLFTPVLIFWILFFLTPEYRDSDTEKVLILVTVMVKIIIFCLIFFVIVPSIKRKKKLISIEKNINQKLEKVNTENKDIKTVMNEARTLIKYDIEDIQRILKKVDEFDRMILIKDIVIENQKYVDENLVILLMLKEENTIVFLKNKNLSEGTPYCTERIV